MHLKTRNVNTAFQELVKFFDNGVNDRKETFFRGVNPIVRQSSRNGAVLRIDEPVTITYTHPRERVLFNAERDANPFFHLYESLWMLAGRNDVESLAYYCSKFRDFSDDGVTLNGAYGYRWRHAADPGEYDKLMIIDQLNILVQYLKADPNSRRAVLSMWNVEDDLLKVGKSPCPCGGSNKVKSKLGDMKITEGCGRCLNGLTFGSKDVCCNLSVMFSLRESAKAADLSFLNLSVEEKANRWGKTAYELDMTVTNRSNDLLWGLLGANYVHFSILQEYLAARLGVEVGLYHHFTNNLHVYCDRPDWRPEAFLDWETANQTKGKYLAYGGEPFNTVPLVRDPEAFERELLSFVRLHDGTGYHNEPNHPTPSVWSEPFLDQVARPMLNAFHLHKLKALESAIWWTDHVKADDWRIAARGWLERRAK